MLHSGEEVRKILAMKTKGKGKRGRQTGKRPSPLKERWEHIRFAIFPICSSLSKITFWIVLWILPIRFACSRSDEGEKLLGDYDNRIGQMGEFAFMEAVKAACQEIPEHPILIVTAFDVRKSLWEKKINGTKKIGALKRK